MHIQFSGLIAASLGTKEKWIEVPEQVRIQEVLDLLSLPVDRRWTVTSVNGVVKQKNAVLKEGDELFIFPVGGGGSNSVSIQRLKIRRIK